MAPSPAADRPSRPLPPYVLESKHGHHHHHHHPPRLGPTAVPHRPQACPSHGARTNRRRLVGFNAERSPPGPPPGTPPAREIEKTPAHNTGQNREHAQNGFCVVRNRPERGRWLTPARPYDRPRSPAAGLIGPQAHPAADVLRGIPAARHRGGGTADPPNPPGAKGAVRPARPRPAARGSGGRIAPIAAGGGACTRILYHSLDDRKRSDTLLA